ncbi:MAG: thermonuclease family protein [Lentilitoribacter sp.]
MLRFLLTTLALPALQRALPHIIRAGKQGMEEARAKRAEKERGTAHYDRIEDVVVGVVNKIVDGDSLYIDTHDKQVRLWGVNAPERHEVGYNAATQSLRDLAFGRKLRVEIVGIDKYGRTLGRCYFEDDIELNHELIKTGNVKEYFRFTKGDYSNLR